MPEARVRDLPAATFEALLADPGVGVRIGPFDLHMTLRVRGLAATLHALYRDYPLLAAGRVFSAHVALHEARHWLRGPRRAVRFTVDGRAPHGDMPREHALAIWEWGLNLVIALRFHRFLMLHAAVVERGGRALLLPAMPGLGKTTLCAALAHRGWRLLSDEFGLLRPDTVNMLALPRPMPLKNESIAVLRAFAPQADIGPAIAGTVKGTVAHVRAPTDSVAQADEPAPAAWVVFPQWQAGEPTSLTAIGAAEGFMGLATNAFNYEMLGEAAFRTVRRIVETAPCFRLRYSDLDDAVTTLDALAGGRHG